MLLRRLIGGIEMLNHLKNEANIAYTENGAVTNASTMSDCLDLFAVIGALRAADDQEITRRFVRAYAEKRKLRIHPMSFSGPPCTRPFAVSRTHRKPL